MKKLLVPFYCLALASAVYFSNGCANTPQAKMYQVEGVIISSVDTTMKIWKDYVVAGKATQAQVDNVKKAYNYYYDAQLCAKAALELSMVSTNAVDIATAQASAHSAEDALISAITQIVTHK